MQALKSSSVLENGGIYSKLQCPSPSTLDTPESLLEGGKIPAVCRAIREAAENFAGEKYLKVMVMSHARYSIAQSNSIVMGLITFSASNGQIWDFLNTGLHCGCDCYGGVATKDHSQSVSFRF